MEKIKAYLAGPEVFFENAREVFEASVALCNKYNVIPLSPVDSGSSPPPEGLGKAALAKWIFEKNCRLIEEADIIIANLNPFRGFEPDSGTVWECGYAFGLQKPGFCFMNDTRPMAEKLTPVQKDGERFCEYGFRVENFGSPLNLMLSSWMTVCEGGLEEALQAVAKQVSPLKM